MRFSKESPARFRRNADGVVASLSRRGGNKRMHDGGCNHPAGNADSATRRWPRIAARIEVLTGTSDMPDTQAKFVEGPHKSRSSPASETPAQDGPKQHTLF
jgi:hypothetical protein